MTKDELLTNVSQKTGVTKPDTKFMYEAFMDAIIEELVEKGEVHIDKFGTFYVGSTTVSEGFQTGKAYKIKTVRFRASGVLKSSLSSPDGNAQCIIFVGKDKTVEKGKEE